MKKSPELSAALVSTANVIDPTYVPLNVKVTEPQLFWSMETPVSAVAGASAATAAPDACSGAAEIWGDQKAAVSISMILVIRETLVVPHRNRLILLISVLPTRSWHGPFGAQCLVATDVTCAALCPPASSRNQSSPGA